MIHLDTTFLVDVIRESRRDEQGPARRWLARNPHETLGISVFVLCELLTGAALHADSAAERRRVMKVVGQLPVITPDAQLAGTYARIHAVLTKQGTPVANMDLLIACTALNAGSALLTANQRDFTRIPGLDVLDHTE